MDDHGASNGLSGWAWYQLGSMDAERRQRARQTVRQLFGRRQQTVDVNHVLAQNQALAAENARLRRDLDGYKHNYNRLRAWAEEAQRDLDRLQKNRD